MKTKDLVLTGMLLAMGLVFQIGFRQFGQPVVGTLVNMILIMAVLMVGVPSAVLIGVTTPVVAFLLGISPLMPLIPIIAVGNCLLVVMFSVTDSLLYKYEWRQFANGVVAAIFKFIFFFIAIRSLLPLFIAKVPPKIYIAFGISQLYTAIAGATLAVILYKFTPIKKALK